VSAVKKHELYDNRTAAAQHAHDMKVRATTKGDIETRTATLRTAMEARGHEFGDDRVQGSRSIVAFCKRCGKDGWAKVDGTLTGDAITADCAKPAPR
jgi:hypothetical protein